MPVESKTDVVKPDPAMLDVAAIRADFPILSEKVRSRPLVYLDNAATAQKPSCVIDAVSRYYQTTNANIHRGVHALSVKATEAYERARQVIQKHIGAEDWRELIFVRGATEAINLVAGSYGRANVGRDDEIVVSAMEHHSNIVPWQMLAESVGARVRVLPMDERGVLRLEALSDLLNERTKIVAVTHVSNSLGTINPIREIVDQAHQVGAVVVVDGAQALPHMPIDVRELGCDFYACSSHKAFGPSGSGILYARRELLEAMPPYEGGGEMIKSVSFERTVYNDVPHKFEAGTPNIEGPIGWAAALEYMQAVGLDNIEAYERMLASYAESALLKVPGLRLIGTAPHKAAVFSFVLGEIHAHDVGTILDSRGIAVRTGHHCTQPVMEFFNVPATTRASLAFNNTTDEIDELVSGLTEVSEMFSR